MKENVNVVIATLLQKHNFITNARMPVTAKDKMIEYSKMTQYYKGVMYRIHGVSKSFEYD